MLLLCGAIFVGGVAGADVKVTFAPGTETGPTENPTQTVDAGVLTSLRPVSEMGFTAPTYTDSQGQTQSMKFIGWKIGETNTFYTDQQAVKLTSGVTLTAQWAVPDTTWAGTSISAAGYYQLKNDVSLTATVTVSAAPVVIDLNDNVLSRSSGTFSIITVSDGGVLTLTDNAGTKTDKYFQVSDGATALYPQWQLLASDPEDPEHTIALSDIKSYDGADGGWAYNNGTSYKYKYVTVTGGCITGGSAWSGGGVFVAGEFTMFGGNIVGNSAPGYGGGVYVAGEFTMSGGSITGNSAEVGGGVYVTGTGEFTMSGGNIAGNSAGGGGGVYVWAGTFNMSGDASIKGNRATGYDTGEGVVIYGGGVCVVEGTFTMEGGSITGNRATGYDIEEDVVVIYGGGVCVIGGTFTMEGGSITGNSAEVGGGVYVYADYVYADCEFTMSGGTIVGNSAVSGGGVCVAGWVIDEGGGDVSVWAGTFNMSGTAEITGNSAEDVGGGVYVWAGTFTMEGGSITGNRATGYYIEDEDVVISGGGVCVMNGTFTMSGTAEITGNSAVSGGGVCVFAGTFNVSGSPVISGNTDGTNANNVYLEDTNPLKLVGNFSGMIYINNPAPTVGGEEPFGTAGTDSTGNAYKGAANFISDGVSEHYIGVIGELVEPSYKLNWSGSPATFHTIIVENAVTGKLIPSASTAAEGALITLAPAPGYTMSNPTAYKTGDSGTTITITDNSFTMEDYDVTVTAKCTANTYTVTLNDNGGTGGSGSVTATYDAAMPTPITLPTKTGYTFNGYFDATTGGNKYYNAEGNSAKNWDKTTDTTLYAQWESGPAPPTHKVTFDANGHGTAPAAQTVTSGEKATEPADPEAAGYTFGGWYTEDTCDNLYDFNTLVTSDRTLYAKWTINTYTVTFNMKGHGTQIPAATVNPGSTVTRPSPDPSAIGCIFGGWFTDSGCTAAYDFSTAVTGNKTLYAKWDIVNYTAKVDDYTYGGTVPKPYVTPSGLTDVTFSYILNGQEHPWDTLTPTTLDAGSYYVRAVDNTGTIERIKDSSFTVNKAEQVKPDIRVEAVPGGIETTITNYMSGYTYQYRLGEDTWILVPTGSNSFTIPGLAAETPYTVTVKINAKGNYKESISDSKTVTTLGTFSVSYNANGGVGTIEPQTATMGESITVASPEGIITRSGYTFTKWTTKPDGTGEHYAAGAPIDKGAVLYAQWDAMPYILTLDGNGGTISGAKTVAVLSEYGDNTYINLSQYPAVHSGSQNHIGWALTPGSKSALYAPNQKVQNLGDITLYAVWVNKTYGLTVKVLKEDNSTPVEGANVTLKLGSTEFMEPGWSSDGEVIFSDVPEGNYTLVAEKDGKTVTVAVTVNDKLSDPVRVIIPAGNVSSIVDVKDGTPAVAVGGLAETAADSAKEGDKVTVTVTVETKTEGASASSEDQETQIEIEAINKEAKKAADSKTEYLGINIKKQVNEKEPEKITSTANVLEFIIPFDFSGKKNVIAYRCHEGEVKPLEKISGRVLDEKERKDGRYYPDTANDMIYLYSSLFSTYGVNYTTSDTPTPSHSSSSGSSIWATPTPAPTVTPTPAVTQTPGTEVPTVSPLPTQTGASPAPVAGVLAGLGAAAVVFGLRMRRK